MKILILVLFSVLLSQSVFSSPVSIEPVENLNLTGNTKAYMVKDGAVHCVIVYMDGISCNVERGSRIDISQTANADLKFKLEHLSRNISVTIDVSRRVVGSQLCYFIKRGAGNIFSCVNP